MRRVGATMGVQTIARGGLLAVAASVWLGAAGPADGGAALREAARAGDHVALRSLLKQHLPVDTPEADGTTALHWAVRSDDFESVDLLLRAGASAKAANRYGVTPLSLAALNGDVRIIEALLKAGADPNARLAEEQTILMAAARAGNPDAVRALLEHGAEPNAREHVLGETALMWAALEDHAGAIEVLVAHGADVNARSDQTTFPRFKFGDGIVARSTILPRGGWTALMYAARQGAVHATRALADAGADLNRTDPNGTSALVSAIINLHFDLAALLIDKGADPNVAETTGMAALYTAVDMHTLPETVGRPNPKPRDTIDGAELVKALLEHGANPNARLSAPILDRVHNDANSDAALGDGATPLMRAAKQADVAIMQLLLDHHADPALATKKGATALMFAASRSGGFRGVGARASEDDALKAVSLCLDRGAPVNAVDDTGQTALHLAVATGPDSIVRLLAEKGADLFLKDQRGRTPLDVALGVGAGGRGRGGQNAGLAAGEGRGAGGAPPAANAARIALLRSMMAAQSPKGAAAPQQ
jgi:ankyrin repeat protein